MFHVAAPGSHLELQPWWPRRTLACALRWSLHVVGWPWTLTWDSINTKTSMSYRRTGNPEAGLPVLALFIPVLALFNLREPCHGPGMPSHSWLSTTFLTEDNTGHVYRTPRGLRRGDGCRWMETWINQLKAQPSLLVYHSVHLHLPVFSLWFTTGRALSFQQVSLPRLVMAVKSLLKCVGCGSAGRQLANHSIPARGLLSALTWGPLDAALEGSCKSCGLVSAKTTEVPWGRALPEGRSWRSHSSPKMTF